MDAHESDGITFRYDGRTSWHGFLKAVGMDERRVPVTWAEFKRVGDEKHVEVYFREEIERERLLQEDEPFLVAVVKGPADGSRKFEQYIGAFRVRPRSLVGRDSLLAVVLERIDGQELLRESKGERRQCL